MSDVSGVRAKAVVDGLLTWLGLARPDKGIRRDHALPPGYFRDAEALDRDVLDGGLGHDRLFFDPDGEPITPSLVPQWDVALLQDAPDGGALQLTRCRRIHPKEVRGRVGVVTPVMAEIGLAFIDTESVAMDSARGWFGWRSGRWVELGGALNFDDQPNRPDYVIRVAQSIALTREYEWAVSVRYPGTPSVRLPSDPTGIRHMWQARNESSESGRRAALLHWVTDHWRRNRNDPDEEIYVRKHLRGAQGFEFAGLRCTVIPSQYDASQAERAKVERGRMREQGHDRRAATATKEGHNGR